MQAAISLSVTTDTSVASVPVVSISPNLTSERPGHSKPTKNVFALGDYLIGDTEDNMLSGHPDIRY
ncbi:hypothetical protein [Hymenobacter crusticola]|uniref:Uncharacterized protein n=1 Tax=Hymenobacter crusticola TaxID=1770526 RepID=A0A243WCK5_9BACT|nr:hypothetical protein [Hymenobacter crusticola]OUJ73370.1 hypothetical protein BXP70_13215 [Hymenobacter crusticola]